MRVGTYDLVHFSSEPPSICVRVIHPSAFAQSTVQSHTAGSSAACCAVEDVAATRLDAPGYPDARRSGGCAREARQRRPCPLRALTVQRHLRCTEVWERALEVQCCRERCAVGRVRDHTRVDLRVLLPTARAGPRGVRGHSFCSRYCALLHGMRSYS